jgi:hypothetical protein
VAHSASENLHQLVPRPGYTPPFRPRDVTDIWAELLRRTVRRVAADHRLGSRFVADRVFHPA